jgi:hypothetical protein
MIVFTRPPLWDMARYLLSEVGVYMMTKKMPGKEAMSLVMFVAMSQQLTKYAST